MPTTLPYTVCKIDEDRQIIFGWASVVVTKEGEPLEDFHGDVIDPDDLQDAAYTFLLEHGGLNEVHQGAIKGMLVESMVITKDKLRALGLPGQALPVGWLVSFYVEDPDAFAKVKSGEYRMLSIEGTAVPMEVP